MLPRTSKRRRVFPSSLRATVSVGDGRLPGSKSIAQRALVFAAAAVGRSQVVCGSTSADVQSTQRALADLGCPVSEDGCLEGRGDEPWRADRVRLGESATLARLLLGLTATRAGSQVTLLPGGTLRSRRPLALVRVLRGLGARLAGDGYELRVRGVDRDPPWRLSRPDSSQDVSALLGALAARGGGRLEVEGSIPSRPYVELTGWVLARFGVEVVDRGDAFEVRGTLRSPAEPLVVEPDASAAATLLCAAVVSDGCAEVLGLGTSSAQGDTRIVEHLRAFGVEADAGVNFLAASGRPKRGAVLDLSSEPDLAPVLALVAARAARDHGVGSELGGLETLRGKESDRVAALADLLSQLGFGLEERRDALHLTGAFTARPVAPLDARADHRIAFALALAGTFLDGVRVIGPDCVAKSWPSFWDTFRAMGVDWADE